MTNRWSTAKGNTVYAYDAVGNLTNINYPASTDIKYQYDELNRLTIMVDASGTNSYTYTSGGQLWTEDGPWASDTVTNIYNNRMRTGLSLAQPTGSWTNGFGYDAAKRLTSVTSPAGTYTYLLGAASAASPLPKKITLANTSYITNTYDTMARLTGTYLKTSGNVLTNKHEYAYNTGNQRTQQTFMDAATYGYTYDRSGQLTNADSSVAAQDRKYVYDAAWNLNYRTNDTTVNTFTVDGKNQLTNATPTGPQTYDDNGNLITARPVSTINYRYCYDDENQLVRWIFSRDPLACDDGASNNSDERTDFVYDGKGRLRVRVEYDGDKFQDSWTTNAVVRYVYDGMRVIQERNSSNTPTVGYTRGTDLSGSLEGAGGIGGLLGRANGSAGNLTNHSVYHADGNGNVTYMLNSSQSVVASYRYDPFGNTISSSGTLVAGNVYRFSSKEIHVNSSLYYYGYRFYHPNLQRWLNRDPIMENGGINLYDFTQNDPIGTIDPNGLLLWGCSRRPWEDANCLGYSLDQNKDLPRQTPPPAIKWEDYMKSQGCRPASGPHDCDYAKENYVVLMTTDDTWDNNADVMHSYCIKTAGGPFGQKTGPPGKGKVEDKVEKPGEGIEWPKKPEIRKYCCPSAKKKGK